ncbi:6-phospho-beta-glucosidase [Dactylosporangium aurantiacum]|uniref:6-phospho-beta-glucosidase n=1 Tax=Dactylosporangium aurantiacum TaxID=35754 RepID=A0A9Q9IC20_9ACTN|nr:6-phospho-beta-glucosidase [Dactylosporangium aurantiacum]MDG6106511.1 6-phospho-beta-glucosidase [Dactylosporangium aurantiacum]UWZ50458.1 6-phospho-beta-glucosidase [Dactylosporangium aurantiacum]
MKIAVVGGGSTYTPELIDGFARLAPFASEIVLLDPAHERLEVVGAFARRLMAAHGHPGTLRWTSDVDDALAGAATVVIQLRVGGQAARISDETFPLACDCVGQETTGAGGLAKALRTVPVVLDIARRADPGAWIVNFTNPVGIVTRALLDHGFKAAGLCNVAIGFQRRFAATLGVDPAAVLLDHVGLNHLTWERAVYVDGVDQLPRLLSAHLDDVAAEVRIPAPVLATLGTVPSYYLRYFYCHDLVVREERGGPTRGATVAGIEAQLLRMYADPALTAKPELLGQRGGAFYSEAAVGLIASLQHDDGGIHAVNVRNAGTMPFLPDDAVIEVTCRIGAGGATPLPVSPLSPHLRGLVGAVSAYEELAVDAAVRGGRDRVYQALLAHPLVGQHEQATRLTDDLLAANRDHLAWLS